MNLAAVIEAVCISTPGVRVAKQPLPVAFIGEHGLEGDRHAREHRRLRDGRLVRNERQWSAVASDEVAELCAELGVPLFAPGALGENLRLGGVRLAEVADGAVLELPSGARLRVAFQNDPCVNAAAALAATYGGDVARYFVQKAMGRRGIVGDVLTPGLVRAGDAVSILLPALP